MPLRGYGQLWTILNRDEQPPPTAVAFDSTQPRFRQVAYYLTSDPRQLCAYRSAPDVVSPAAKDQFCFRGTHAFGTPGPRFMSEAFYSTRDARQLAAKERSPNKMYDPLQPHLRVRDPHRQDYVFASRTQLKRSDAHAVSHSGSCAPGPQHPWEFSSPAPHATAPSAAMPCIHQLFRSASSDAFHRKHAQPARHTRTVTAGMAVSSMAPFPRWYMHGQRPTGL